MQRLSWLAKTAGVAGSLAAGALSMLWALLQAADPWPLEYREAAVVLTTAEWVAGRNPWSLELQPQFVNVYGFLYHLAAYPFARAFGATLLVHRLLSLACLLGGAGVLVWVMHRERVGWAWCAAAAGLLLAFQCTDISIVARPDSLAVLLFLASIAVPWAHGFSTRSLVAAGGLAVAAFFAKPYLLLGAPLVALYLFLFRSWKRGVVYGCGVLVGLGLLCLLADTLLPAYFTNTFFIHVNANTPRLAHLLLVLPLFLAESAPLLVMAATASAGALRSPEPPRESGMLARLDPGLPAFAFLVNLLIILTFLGHHVGNGILYYHQLLTPFLLWATFRRVPTGGPLAVAFAVAVAAAGVYSTSRVPALPADQTDQWGRVEQLVAQTPRFLAPPPLALLAYSQGREIYDNGQTEYCVAGTRFNRGERAEEYTRRCRSHVARLNASIAARWFDKVVVVPTQSPMVDRETLRKGYTAEGFFFLPSLFSPFPAEVWVRTEATAPR